MKLPLERDAAGWLNVPLQDGAEVLYVSSATGNDANPGTRDKPLKTLAWLGKRMRASTAKQRVGLLRSGDQWIEPLPDLPSGTSWTAMTLIASYGPGARAMVRPRNAYGLLSHGDVFVAIVDIHFRADSRLPGDAAYDKVTKSHVGLSFSVTQNILVMGCRVEGFEFGINAESSDDKRSAQLILFRNIVVRNYCASGGLSSGSYISYTDGVWMESNVYYHNGAHEKMDGAWETIYNHNIYIHATNTDVTFIDNVTAYASSHGVQVRSGGIVRDNAILVNAIGASFGLVEGGGPCTVGGVYGDVSRNLFYSGKDTGSQKRGTGIEIGNVRPAASTTVANNLFLEGHGAGFPAVMVAYGHGKYEDMQVGVHDVSFASNVVCRYPGPSVMVQAGMRAGVKGKDTISGAKWVANNLGGAPIVNGAMMSWDAGAGGNYADPTRTPETYAVSLGYKAENNALAHVAMLEDACRKEKETWDPRLLGRAISSWCAAGYMSGGGTPTPTPTPTPPPDAEAPVVTDVYLVDDATDLPLVPRPVDRPDEITVDIVRFPKCYVIAKATGKVGQVDFSVPGSDLPPHTETAEPYTYPSRPQILSLRAGTYIIRAVPKSPTGAVGVSVAYTIKAIAVAPPTPVPPSPPDPNPVPDPNPAPVVDPRIPQAANAAAMIKTTVASLQLQLTAAAMAAKQGNAPTAVRTAIDTSSKQAAMVKANVGTLQDSLK